MAELSQSAGSSEEGLHQIGPDGSILWANQSELAMLGYTANEYIGQPMQKFYVNPQVAADILHRLQQGEMIRDYPVVLRRRPGDVCNVLMNSGGQSAEGRFIHTRRFVADIPTQKNEQNAQSLLAAIVDSSDDAIISKTLDGIILSWNAGAARLFEYTAEEAIGQSVLLLIPPELHSEEQVILNRLRNGERIRHYETVRVAKSGRRIDISLTISPLRDANGRVIGASKIARDITERKRFEAELLEADRRKDEFLAMLGHELRNPLGPIRNAAALIEMVSQDQPQLKEATDIIERQVRHMGRIIDDLLDVTRISRGKIKLVTEPLDFRRLILQVANDFRPLIESGGIALTSDILDDELWVKGDSVRLSQVVGNLLHNAYKFCDRGASITVRLLWLKTLGEAKLSIQDTGTGISAEMLPRLFLPFSQDEKSLDRSRGGLGLGLALVHGLIDLHGGSVEAASPGPGQGATFTVRLPLVDAPQQRPPQRRTEDRSNKSLSILVIDDQRDAVRTLERLLARLGHNVMTAVNGEEGIRIALEAAPQVIFSDIGLPGMSGYDVARAIRGNGNGASLLLVAVTGYGREEDMQQAFAAGFDRHLVKPVSLSDLIRLLDSV